MIKQNRTGQSDMFGSEDEAVELLAQKYFSAILEKQKIDFVKGHDYHTVDTNTIENKDFPGIRFERVFSFIKSEGVSKSYFFWIMIPLIAGIWGWNNRRRFMTKH